MMTKSYTIIYGNIKTYPDNRSEERSSEKTADGIGYFFVL